MPIVKVSKKTQNRKTAQSETWPVYNPIGFEPNAVLPRELQRHGDFVRYLLGKLHWERVFDRRNRDSFVELKADYLRKLLPHTNYWRPVKKALLEEKVLLSDNHYIKSHDGEVGKCIGFKLGPKYASLPQRQVLLTDKFLVKKLNRHWDSNAPKLDVHKHLFRFLRKLSIDYDSALEHIFEITRDDETGEAFAVNESAIRMIRAGDYHFTPCKYGRVHTNVTSLKTELRQFLRHEGLPLVNLDIRNSQPLFFGILLSNYLLNDKNLDNINNFSVSNLSVYSESFFSSSSLFSLSSPTPPLRCNFLHTEREELRSLERRGMPEDAICYIDLCQEGKLYDYLMEKGNVTHGDRKSFKGKFFASVFFCKNEPIRQEAVLFEKLFPSAYEVVRELKSKDYSQLSKLLQRVESSFMINRVVRTLMNEFPDLPLYSIHDSLMTTEEHSGTVQRVMMDQFRTIGFIPTINVERY